MYPYRCWVEISRCQILENFRNVRAVVGPSVQVIPVVKAEAYGHGLLEVARLLERDGAGWLAVSNVNEGISLRDAGINCRILVMGGLLTEERQSLFDYGLTPVIHSLEDLTETNEAARKRAQVLRYHLKVDTGMGRLGALESAEEICRAISQARHIQLEGLMTHFASSADYTSDQTEHQLRAFNKILNVIRQRGIEPKLIHLSSTNAVAYGRSSAWGNLVRVGHALYGYVSAAQGPAPTPILRVRPALSWKARILTVKDVPEGTCIGYNAMYRTPRRTRIAVVAAGYADGYPHQLSNRGKIIAAGALTPILGAISMDVMTIDISQAPNLKAGDAVTLLGSEGDLSVDAQHIAQLAGTISYSVLCGIHPRVKRIYI
jgi:alanine racemase